MPKQLRLNKLDSRGSLTVRELVSYLGTCDPDSPVVLKCNKNYRLGKMLTSVKTKGPILIGKRSALK
jgi:hypothetical protein